MIPLFKLSHAIFITLLLSVTVNAIASEITSPNKTPTSLSIDDQKLYNESLNLINQFNGTDDKLEKANVIIIDLMTRNPNSGYPYAAYADLKFRLASMGNGTYSDVYTLARRALNFDPNIADAYVVITKVMIASKNYNAARDAANTAISIAPNKPEAMFAMARVAEIAMNFDKSEYWYRKAIETHKDNIRKSNIYWWLGQMLSRKSPENLSEATEALIKSAELGFNDLPVNLKNIGYFLISNTDQYEKAIGYFEQSLKIQELDDAKRGLGLAEFYKWGDAYINPAKYKYIKRKPLTPKEITESTGVTPELAFITNAQVRNTPSATLALLKAGVIKNVDATTQGNSTALIAATYSNQMALVKILVAKGANVNAEDPSSKWTPLVYAVQQGNLEMVKFLVSNGARINSAIASGYPVTVYSLNQKTGKPASILNYLLEHGADPTIPDKKGSTLIVNAVSGNDIDAVQLLINKYHVDVNSKYINTPILQMAAGASGWEIYRNPAKSKEIVAILLKAGANPWIWDGDADLVTKLSNPKFYSEQEFPIFKEISNMLIEARNKSPMPSGFGQTIKPQ